MGAGSYDTRFIWLKQTVTKEGTFGQEEETFTSNGELWGALEELSAGERMAFGLRQSLADVRIRIRNQPAIAFTDRLQDKGTSEVYLIDGINYGDNELVITAHCQREV